MLTVEQAQKKFIQSVSKLAETEEVELHDALLRVSANTIKSPIDVPPTDNSAMDGFAVSIDSLNSGITELEISQRIPAGFMPEPLVPGTAARIFTGGVMPNNADAVVIQENCKFDEVDNRVRVLKPVEFSANVRPKGQDIAKGSVVVAEGKRLTALDLGLLASVGCSKIAVYKKVKVAIFSTGDELVEPGTPLKDGQIYNSNRTVLMAVCRQLGCEVIDCGIVEDELPATVAALERAASQADIIVTSGGVSVGEEDHVKPAIEKLGSLDHWKVQMKPGKPVVLGEVQGTPVLGLPGNPVSSYIVFLLLGMPMVRVLQGQSQSAAKPIMIAADFAKSEVTREEYIRAKLGVDAAGQPVLKKFSNSSSGVLSSLSWADGLIRQRIGQKINVGDAVEFLPLYDGMLR